MLCVTRWWFQNQHNSDMKASFTWYLYQVFMYASSLLRRQGPWMTFDSATTCRTSHRRNMTQQSTHTMNKGPWTVFLCTQSITCEYGQLDWSHNTFHKGDESLCLLTSNSRQAHVPCCTMQQALYTHKMVNKSTVVPQTSITPTRNECT